jgi:uncharacterized repeat protein (TIGR03803 family)
VETPLYSSCSLKGCVDGYSGYGPLLIDAVGNLIGTFEEGGAGKGATPCCGTAFKLTPNGAQSVYNVIHNFCSRKNCKDGVLPAAGLISDSSGNLFGTTDQGGTHALAHGGGGTVFELTGSTIHTLYDFCAKNECRDGANPAGPLIMDAAGNLYGTTQNGGAAETGGTIFELSP